MTDKWISFNKKPMPLNTPVRLRLRGGEIIEHAVRFSDGIFAGKFAVDYKRITGWQLKPPATFRFPGDEPGTYTPPVMVDEEEQ